MNIAKFNALTPEDLAQMKAKPFMDLANEYGVAFGYNKKAVNLHAEISDAILLRETLASKESEDPKAEDLTPAPEAEDELLVSDPEEAPLAAKEEIDLDKKPEDKDERAYPTNTNEMLAVANFFLSDLALYCGHLYSVGLSNSRYVRIYNQLKRAVNSDFKD